MKLIELKETENGPIRIYSIDYYYLPKHNLHVYTESKLKEGYVKCIHKAMCTYDIEENYYTMYSIDKGGPIIVKSDLGEIVSEYKEMFIFTLGLRSLMNVINDKKLD